MFDLHPRLAADTFEIAELPVSRALLMNDARYPWVILVPRQNDLKELHQLSEEDGVQLWKEINFFSGFMEGNFPCDKVNVGALGNLVPQLHIHVIARQDGDAAWPGPIWGVGETVAYDEDEKQQRLELIREGIKNAF